MGQIRQRSWMRPSHWEKKLWLGARKLEVTPTLFWSPRFPIIRRPQPTKNWYVSDIHKVDFFLSFIPNGRDTIDWFCSVNIWATLHLCRCEDLCRHHTKWRLGWHHANKAFFWYDTDYSIVIWCLHRLYSIVGVIPSKGLAGSGPLSLLLVWQVTRTKTWGPFKCSTTRVYFTVHNNLRIDHVDRDQN